MNELLKFSAPISLQAASGEHHPRIDILAYTGDVMTVGGWGHVAIDLNGLRADGQVAILADHNQALDGIVGFGTAMNNGRNLQVSGTIANATDAARKVLDLHKGGFAFQASVGVQPQKTIHVQAGESVSVNGRTIKATEDFTLVRSGVLREVSITALGADANTAVSIAAAFSTLSQGLIRMDGQTTNTPPKTNNDMLIAERDRVSSISAMIDATMTRIGEIMPTRLSELKASAISQNWTKDQTELALLKAERDAVEIQRIRAERPTGPMIHASGRERFRDSAVIEAALLAHMGREDIAEKALGASAMEAAKSMRCTHIMDIIKGSLQARGIDVPADRNAMVRAAFSYANLPGILSNTANKLMEQSYRAFPSVARQIARKLTANDFKQHTGYRLTGDTKMQEVGPAGEIKHGTLGESSYFYKVSTFARMFALTRQDIINDDLGAFDEVPSMIGRGSAVALEELFWQLVLANTGNFFHANNKNYISGTTTALSIEGLRQAVQAMRQQVDAQGTPIMVEPKFLVVPAALEATADTIYASTNIVMAADTATPDGNPYKGKYQPLVVPHLSDDDVWYLLGSPADVAAFGIAFLSGQDSPTVETSDADFNVLGIQFRGYLDFGACQIDPKGGVMSAGK